MYMCRKLERERKIEGGRCAYAFADVCIFIFLLAPNTLLLLLNKKIKDLRLTFTPALKTIEEEKNVTERFERWEDNDG